MVDFRCNAWGGTYGWDLDDRITPTLHAAGAFGTLTLNTSPLTLEGGAIETDGAGTLLAVTRTIELTTVGRRSGRLSRIEIWWFHVGGRFIVTGTPGRRDWYANVLAHPEVVIHSRTGDHLGLASPILDTAFVVAKRIKYRQPIYQADRWHFHHRFANMGFSQRKTLAYLYGWTLILALLALALRFVPYSDDRGNFDPLWTVIMAAVILLAVVASVYLAVVLEIVKRRSPREAAEGPSEGGGGGESESDPDRPGS